MPHRRAVIYESGHQQFSGVRTRNDERSLEECPAALGVRRRCEQGLELTIDRSNTGSARGAVEHDAQCAGFCG